MRTNALLASFVLGLLPNCHPQTEVTINSAPHAMSSRRPEAVELFAFAPPSRPHVDVAIFAFGGQRTLGEVRAHAARLGCDGVVIHSMVYATAALVVDAASCIVYTNAPSSAVSMQQATAESGAPHP